MALVSFHHDFIPNDLYIQTGADNINWTYTLNTQRYPTYGGEVVQILSCFIDTLTIQGTVARQQSRDRGKPVSDAGMEDIYQWFLTYMQIASQGGKGTTAYSERYITFSYPERGWVLNFQCQELPGYALDRNTVAPTWQISGKVVEVPKLMSGMTLDDILAGGAGGGNGVGADVKAFQRIQDGIDLSQPDPANNPFNTAFPTGAKTSSQQQQLAQQALQNLGGQFGKIVQSWANGDFSSVLGSTPSQFNNPTFGPTPRSANPIPPTQAAGKKKKK
jgi:hypothetical protein